jgi:hypothetical protein
LPGEPFRPIRAFHRTLKARRAAGERFPVPLLLLYAERDAMVPPRFVPPVIDFLA